MAAYTTANSDQVECDGDAIEITPAEEYDSQRVRHGLLLHI